VAEHPTVIELERRILELCGKMTAVYAENCLYKTALLVLHGFASGTKTELTQERVLAVTRTALAGASGTPPASPDLPSSQEQAREETNQPSC
jgi:hypothetical protein